MENIRINESDIKNMVFESVKRILFENNYKSPLHKRRAIISIQGRKQGKTPEEIRQDILDDAAKLQAIKDINHDRSIRTMSKHEKRFNNLIGDDTFNTDFEELDYYDPYFDDFSKNNKEVEGGNDPWYYGETDYIDQ